MAINCDYCQKPLSLMRRLRGEQFCSVEHMDLYIAQQAEFALERLAAAADEKPNTARPPALLRRPAHPPAEEFVSVPAEEVSVAVPPANGHEYPMASFVEQMPSIRESEADAAAEELAPAESWGNASAAWSMPDFEFEPASETKPASEPKEDPRTWNAGKLVSQVPPLARMRDFLAVRELEPSESSTVAIARIHPAPESFSVDPALPSLSAEVEHVKEAWSDDQLRQIFATPAGHRMPRPVNSRPSGIVTPDLIDATPILATLNPAPPQAWIGLELAPSGPLFPGLRARAAETTTNTMDGPRFSVATPVLELTATLDSCLPLLSQWRPCELTAKDPAAAILDPAQPISSPLPQAWPPAPAWNLTQSFEAGKVQMPAWALQPALTAVIRTSDGQWQPFPLMAHPPAVPRTVPQFGYPGPAFGWEETPLHSLETSLLASEAPVEGGRPTEFQDLDAPFASYSGFAAPAAPAIPRPPQEMANWDPQRAGTADPLSAPTVAPRMQDIRARLSAKLSHGAPSEDKAWTEARTDASTIQPSLDVTLRPSFGAVEAECPLFRLDAPRFTYAIGRTPEALAAHGPIPASVPVEAADWTGHQSHWFVPAAPRPALRLVPVAIMRPLSAHLATQMDRSPVLASYTRYSPVTLVVMPPHQFNVLAPVVLPEERFVAQPQVNGALPRVRQTGYRAFGPFPKLPARMPDPAFHVAPSEFHAPVLQVPYQQRTAVDDRTGLPKFPPASEMRLHPAHYWAWPLLKAPRATRALPEWFQEVQPTAPDSPEAPVRRFGPGRETGLQGLRRSADGLPKAGA